MQINARNVFPALPFCALMLVAACSKPLTTEEQLNRAETALAATAGDPRAAEVDIKTVLQKDPENARARYLYGLVYLEQMDPSAAIDQFERSLETERRDETLEELAAALLQAGRSAEFLDDRDRGRFVSVQDSYFLAAITARAHAAQQDVDAARQWLETAVTRGQEQAAGALDSPRKRDYLDMTRAMFAGLLDRDTEASSAIVDEILERSPDNAEAWSLRGLLASANDQMERAAESYGRASEINPYRLNDRINYVNAAVRIGDNENAKRELARLKRALPNSPMVNYLQGRLAFAEGDYKEAIDTLSRVLTYIPDNPEALLLSGSANAREGNLATAARQLSQFLAQQPEHVEARLQLAQVRLNMGDPVKAEEMVRNVLKENEMNTSALGLLAVTLSAQGMYAESATAYEQLALLNPTSSTAQMAAGSQKMRAGESGDALKYLREAVELDPASEEAWARLISALAGAGEMAQAREAVDGYLENHPQSPVPYVIAGRLSLAEEDKQAAAGYFERALEIDPGNSLANDGIATLALLDRDYEAAREALERSLAANPGDLPTSIGLAALAERTGSTDAMVEALEGAIDANPLALEPRLALARYAVAQQEFQRAIELLSSVREEHNDDFMLHEVLAGAYAALNQSEGALEHASRLVELRPGDAGALALSARIQMQAGRPEAAETQARAALDIAPDDTNLRRLLIGALVSQNERAAAKTEIDRLPEEIRASPPMLTLRGRLALADREFALAEDLLGTALAEQKTTVNLLLLSTTHWEAGKQDLALQDLRDWLEEFPEDAVVRNALASRALQMGDEGLARRQYARLLEDYPDNVVVLNNLAWLLRADQPDEALELIQRAEELAPDSAQVIDTFAMIQLDNGRRDEALRLNERALRAAPEDPGIRFHRAQILVALGKREEAVEMLEALAEITAFSDKREAMALLDSLR